MYSLVSLLVCGVVNGVSRYAFTQLKFVFFFGSCSGCFVTLYSVVCIDNFPHVVHTAVTDLYVVVVEVFW